MGDLDQTKAVYRKVLFGAVVAVVVALLIYFGYLAFIALTPPSLVSVTPVNQATTISPTTSVLFVFDRVLSADNQGHVSTNPQVQGSVTVKDKTLTFTPAPAFPLGQKVVITVTNPISSTGKAGQTVSTTFTVKTPDQLSATERSQLQYAIDQEFAKQIDTASGTTEFKKANAIYQLIQNTPYDNGTFSVEYVKQTNTFIVSIEKNPFSANQQAANNWIKGNGVVDLSWITIQYTTVKGVSP